MKAKKTLAMVLILAAVVVATLAVVYDMQCKRRRRATECDDDCECED